MLGRHVSDEVNNGLLVACRHFNLADDDFLVGGIELAQLAQFLRGHAERGCLVQRFFAEQAEVVELFFDGAAAAPEGGAKSLPRIQADFDATDNHFLPGQLFVALALFDLGNLRQREAVQHGGNRLRGLQATEQLVHFDLLGGRGGGDQRLFRGSGLLPDRISVYLLVAHGLLLTSRCRSGWQFR